MAKKKPARPKSKKQKAAPEQLLKQMFATAAAKDPAFAELMKLAENPETREFPELDGMKVVYGPWLVVGFPDGAQISMSDGVLSVRLVNMPGVYMMPRSEHTEKIGPIVKDLPVDPHNWPPEVIHKVAKIAREAYGGFWTGFTESIAKGK